MTPGALVPLWMVFQGALCLCWTLRGAGTWWCLSLKGPARSLTGQMRPGHSDDAKAIFLSCHDITFHLQIAPALLGAQIIPRAATAEGAGRQFGTVSLP